MKRLFSWQLRFAAMLFGATVQGMAASLVAHIDIAARR